MGNPAEISQQLQAFDDTWGNVADWNIGEALTDFEGRMAGVGLIYREVAQSKQNCPQVNPFYVSELLDMINTLHICAALVQRSCHPPVNSEAYQPKTFLKQKFLQKLKSMVSALGNTEEKSSEDS
jgi:hypothetical protein